MELSKAINILEKYEQSTKLELSEGHKNNLCDNMSVDEFMDMKRVAVESIKKAMPKEVIKDGYYSAAECPNCGSDEIGEFLGDGYYRDFTWLKFCPNCGQAIVWGSE